MSQSTDMHTTHLPRPTEIADYKQQGLLSIEEALRLIDWYIFGRVGRCTRSEYVFARLAIVIAELTHGE